MKIIVYVIYTTYKEDKFKDIYDSDNLSELFLIEADNEQECIKKAKSHIHTLLDNRSIQDYETVYSYVIDKEIVGADNWIGEIKKDKEDAEHLDNKQSRYENYLELRKEFE